MADARAPRDGSARGRDRPDTLDLLARVSSLGSAAQASIPGLYAWAVTVAPVAWGKGGTGVAKVFAILGLAVLAAALALDGPWRKDSRLALRFPRRARGARSLSVWGLASASCAVWILVPSALTPLRLDATRALAGMLGWALFAFASAAPAIPPDSARSARIVLGAELRPRTRIARGDATFMAVGAAIACMLQAIGWSTAVVERSILVRLVALSAGLAVIGGATTIALARHARRAPASRRERVRRSFPWVSLFLTLLIVGALVQFVLSR